MVYNWSTWWWPKERPKHVVVPTICYVNKNTLTTNQLKVLFDITLSVFISHETECTLRILTSINRRSLQFKHHNYVKWESISSPRHFTSPTKFRSTYLFNACALYKCASNAKCPWHTPSCKSCVFFSERNSGSRSVKGLLDTKSIHPSDSKVDPLGRHHKIYY
jgi:hypothetical protein